MKNRPEKIQKLKLKAAQFTARAASLEAYEKAQQKKIDTRRKILVGAYFLEKFKATEPDLVKELDTFLVRDNDRKLFGLPPKDGVNDGKQEKK